MNDLFFENIDRYVYDECSAEELAEFKNHILECTKCKAEYELACEIKDSLSSMPKIAPPADFSKLLNDRLDKEVQTKSKFRAKFPTYRKYSAVAACVVLAAFLSVDGVKMINKTKVDETLLPDSVSLQTPTIPETEKAEAPASETEEPIGNDFALPTSTPNTNAKSQTPADYQKKSTDTKTATSGKTVSATPSATASAIPTATPQASSGTVTAKDLNLPDSMDPTKHVVLASSVEKEYETTAIDPNDVPVKERDLAAEFALLENPRTGSIIANDATMASLEGVEFQKVKDNRTGKYEYGVGSGSILISSKDKETVSKLLDKYASGEDKTCCYFTADNFNSFIAELKENGISYTEHMITKSNDKVTFKLVIA